MARVRQLIPWLLLALLLYSQQCVAGQYSSQSLAFSTCQSHLSAAKSAKDLDGNPYVAVSSCDYNASPPPYYRCQVRTRTSSAFFACARFSGGDPFDTNYSWQAANSCASRAPFTSTFSPKSGSISCSEGCEQAWFANGDGTSTGQYIGTACQSTNFPNTCGANYYWNAALNVCEPTKEECPVGKTLNSLGQCAPEPCPNGMTQQQDGTCKPSENQCPPGQVKGPDGSCVPKPNTCGTGQAQGADGTCKPDKDGDGKPDDEDSDDDGEDDKKSFSGGDSCASPPSCSGDPIMCGQARIQWRIDCNTRKNRDVAGGGCAATPICTGEKCDAMEYASMLFQWRTACASEKLLAKGNGNGESGQPEWTKVGGMSQDPGAGANSTDTKVVTDNVLSTSDLDQSGLGGGGGCPGFVSGVSASGVSSGYVAMLASPPAFFCDFVVYMRAIIILGAAVACAFILSRGAA